MDWCEERYRIRFDEAYRKSFPPEDPVYKAAHILTTWLDLEESGYDNGVPLGLVMNELGFKGDRSGLLETSVVDDVIYDGRGLSFCVKDNFSEFVVCDLLAEKLGVPFFGTVEYRFSEGENLEFRSGEIKLDTVYPSDMLRDEIEVRISSLLDSGKLTDDGRYLIHDRVAHGRMFVDSVGPDVDEFNLVKEVFSDDDGPDRCRVWLRELDDRASLVYLFNRFDEISKRESLDRKIYDALDRILEFSRDGSPMAVMIGRYFTVDFYPEDHLQPYKVDGLRIDGKDSDGVIHGEFTDHFRPCSGYEWEFKLDGNSHRNKELDVTIDGSRLLPVLEKEVERLESMFITEDEAIEIASHARLADDGETDLSEEVRMEIRQGASPEEALKEWDVEVPADFRQRGKDDRERKSRQMRAYDSFKNSSAGKDDNSLSIK